MNDRSRKEKPVVALKMPKTKYTRISKEEPLRLFIDFGNSDVKAMIGSNYGEEIHFPQYVRRMNHIDYENIADGYSRYTQFVDTAAFSWGGDGYIVGVDASQNGQGVQRLGVDKYDEQHIGALLIASLLMLYPESHPNIILTVTHPSATDKNELKRMARALKGSFSVKTPGGQQINYVVSEGISGIEEPVAVFQTFALSTYGKFYDKPRFDLKPGENFLVIDIGGFISHLVPGRANSKGGLETNSGAAVPVMRGMSHVERSLERELKASRRKQKIGDKETSIAEQLEGITSVPRGMLHQAIMRHEITIRGQIFQCESEVSNAMQTLLSEIASVYNTQFARGADFMGIIVGGGGGMGALPYLEARVLDHPNVFTAERENDYMRYGAIRGASKGRTEKGFLAKNQAVLAQMTQE